MAKNTPKVQNFPLASHTKIPIEQAISQVGRASGLNPQQAGNSAALMNAGISPGKQKFIMAPPKPRQA